MNLSTFIKTYNGKKVDFDNYSGPQCVDLFRQYCKDVRKIPHTGAVEGAKDLWFKFSENDEKKYFLRNTVVTAEIGDIVIWDATSTNKYGHVAIFIAWVDNEMLVFEQNGFTQDGAKFVVRTKENCLGVLKNKL